MKISRTKISNHYKKFFSIENMGLAENDQLMIDWGESLIEHFKPKERFKMPTDKEIIETAILFNNGKIETKNLTNMVAMCEFILNRLQENGHLKAPSIKEKQ